MEGRIQPLSSVKELKCEKVVCQLDFDNVTNSYTLHQFEIPSIQSNRKKNTSVRFELLTMEINHIKFFNPLFYPVLRFMTSYSLIMTVMIFLASLFVIIARNSRIMLEDDVQTEVTTYYNLEIAFGLVFHLEFGFILYNRLTDIGEKYLERVKIRYRRALLLVFIDHKSYMMGSYEFDEEELDRIDMSIGIESDYKTSIRISLVEYKN